MADAEFSFSPVDYFGISNEFLAQLEKPFEFMTNRRNEWVDANNDLRDMYIANMQMPEKLAQTRLNAMTHNYDINNFDRLRAYDEASRQSDEIAWQVESAKNREFLENQDRYFDYQWREREAQLAEQDNAVDSRIVDTKLNEILLNNQKAQGEPSSSYYSRLYAAVDAIPDISENNRTRLRLNIDKDIIANLGMINNNIDKVIEASRELDASFPALAAQFNNATTPAQRAAATKEFFRVFNGHNQTVESVAQLMDNDLIDFASTRETNGIPLVYGSFKDKLEKYKAAVNRFREISGGGTAAIPDAGAAETNTGGATTTAPAQAQGSTTPATTTPVPGTNGTGNTVAPAATIDEAARRMATGEDQTAIFGAPEPEVTDAVTNGQQQQTQAETPAVNPAEAADRLIKAKDAVKRFAPPEITAMIDNPMSIDSPEKAMMLNEFFGSSTARNIKIASTLRSTDKASFDSINEQLSKYMPLDEEVSTALDYIEDRVAPFASSVVENISTKANLPVNAYDLLNKKWPGSELLTTMPVDDQFNVTDPRITRDMLESSMIAFFGEDLYKEIIEDDTKEKLLDTGRYKLLSTVMDKSDKTGKAHNESYLQTAKSIENIVSYLQMTKGQ